MGDEQGCRDAIHRLYEFLDSEITPAVRLEIQRHLDECLPCLEAFDFEAELRQIIATKCREDVPESVRLRVVEALRIEITMTSTTLSTPSTGPGRPGQTPGGRSPLDPLV